jgi:hypothetical protein
MPAVTLTPEAFEKIQRIRRETEVGGEDGRGRCSRPWFGVAMILEQREEKVK